MFYIPLPVGRVCTLCGLWKPYAELVKEKRATNGVRQQCNSCRVRQHNTWRNNNIAHARAWHRDYYANHKAQILDGNRKHRRSKKEHTNERNRNWHHNHPENARRRVAKRRTVKLSLPIAFDDNNERHCRSYWNHCCAVCGRPQGLWHKIAMDHWIPLANVEHCPGTVSTNMIPLCQGIDGCNNSKADRDASEWLASRYGPRKAKRILNRIQDYFEWVKTRD